MARQLQKQFGTSKYEAEWLMRTESARVQADVQSDSFEKAGYTQYKIIAEPTACEICKNAAAGGPYRIADRKIGLNMYPFHPNCRCSATPFIGENDKEKKDIRTISGRSTLGRTSVINPYGDEMMSTRQKNMLEKLQEKNDRIIVKKSEVSMKDLSVFTAVTDVEYGMFTRGGERLIIRSGKSDVDINVEDAKRMRKEGYKFNGHTHASDWELSLCASDGDRDILRAFSQKKSVIYNSKMKFSTFADE